MLMWHSRPRLCLAFHHVNGLCVYIYDSGSHSHG
jgi:hypothetical protein